MTHLFSFIGESDLAAAGIGQQATAADDPGPVSRLLGSSLWPWKAITLVDDRDDPAVAARYLGWLRARHPAAAVGAARCPVNNPASFAEVLAAARTAVARNGDGDERAFLTTPGTAAMAMAWMYLALQPATRGRLVTTYRTQPAEWLPVEPAASAGHCLVLRGIPGAGKSTLARELARSRGLSPADCVFSTDDRFDDLAGGIFDPQMLPRMHQLNLTAFIRALHAKTPFVVSDNTNIEPWEFAAYAAAAEASGYEVSVRVVGNIWDDAWVADRARHNARGVPADRVLDMAARLRQSLKS